MEIHSLALGLPSRAGARSAGGWRFGGFWIRRIASCPGMQVSLAVDMPPWKALQRHPATRFGAMADLKIRSSQRAAFFLMRRRALQIQINCIA